MRFSKALLVSIPYPWEATAVGAPPQSTVIAMAQHFVQEYFMHNSTEHYHVEFDIASLHPQPQPDFWAVVSGFVSEQNIATSNVGGWRSS